METAKQTGRAGFGAMVAFFRRTPACRVLLVEKTDRLYRNLKDWVTLDDVDLEFHFVKENVILSRESRSSEKFMHGIKVLMAKNYIDNLSEETRKGMLEKAEQGLWPSCAPLGYRNVGGPNGKRTIEPDPAVAPNVTRLFERYATGLCSLKELVFLAQADGLVFRRSKNRVPKASIHKILRNCLYMGDFVWKGKRYHGAHKPIVTPELWDRVQATLDHRFAQRHRKFKHSFAFSGLVTCGHCGCSLVGEIKKGRYIYYHCSGYKGKCPEPYTREEVLEERFADLLKGLVFDEEVINWVRQALQESHADEQYLRDEAVTQLQAQHTLLQRRLDTMYEDKLDGRVDDAFFDRKAAEWRAEQARLRQAIEAHNSADRTYMDEGVRLLELARRAYELFRKQEPGEKRLLLNFLLSNSTWRGGTLSATFRQPFDMLVVTTASQGKEKATGIASDDLFDKWRGRRDSNSRPPA